MTRNMKRYFPLLAALCLLAACKGGAPLLPSVSGKAGEVLVVMEKAQWDGELGDATRGLLASECPYLAISEPLYSLVNIAPGAFGDIFRVHRNIVLFNIAPGVDSTCVFYRQDVWAQPQCVVQLNATDGEGARALLETAGANILSAIEQAERDRVIRNTLLYEEKGIAAAIAPVFGGSPHFPSGYKLRKLTDDFAWVADDKQYTMQDVLIYRYPAAGDGTDFDKDRMLRRRAEMARANVPGMYDNTWMITSEGFPVSIEYLGYRGRRFAQMRGYWEVENDYMGGPFVSHSFYSPDGSYVIVAEAFVYSPKFDKRQYLRQVEALLYSWEWKNGE